MKLLIDTLRYLFTSHIFHLPRQLTDNRFV